MWRSAVGLFLYRIEYDVVLGRPFRLSRVNTDTPFAERLSTFNRIHVGHQLVQRLSGRSRSPESAW
jgi:hypothetical protein